MKIEKLKEILDKQFSFPFLPEGMVSTKWIETKKGRELSIQIGRRDVCIDEDGDVIGAGTFLGDK